MRNSHKRVILLAAIGVTMFGAIAALGSKASHTPISTQHTVFGFELDRPLDVPACTSSWFSHPKASDFQYDTWKDTPFTCYVEHIEAAPRAVEAIRHVRIYIAPPEMPVLICPVDCGPVPPVVSATLVDGKLASIEFELAAGPTEQTAFDKLTAKYGKPSTVDRVSLIYTWKQKDGRVTYTATGRAIVEGYAGEVNRPHGTLTVVSTRGAAALAAAEDSTDEAKRRL